MTAEIGQLNKKQQAGGVRKRRINNDQIGENQDKSLKGSRVEMFRPEAALENPSIARPADILTAQQKFGNQTVQRALSNNLSDAQLTNERGELDESISNDIRAASQNGQPLPPAVKDRLGAQLGHNFNEVQIHTDDHADRLSRQINAQAFTIGKHVFFQRGAYAPETSDGHYTLAHELTHVVQQSGQSEIDGPITLGKSDDHFERQAHQTAKELPDRPAAQTNTAKQKAAPPQSGTALQATAASPAATIQREPPVKNRAATWDERVANANKRGPQPSPAWNRRASVGNLRRSAPVSARLGQQRNPAPANPRNSVPPARPARRGSSQPQRPAPQPVVQAPQPQPVVPQPAPVQQAPVQNTNQTTTNLTQNNIGAGGVLKDGLFPGESSILFGADMAGAGLGIASGWVTDDATTSGGLGFASNILGAAGQGYNIGKGIGKLGYGSLSKDLKSTEAGKQVASGLRKEGAMDIVSNTLNLGNTAGSAAVNISKLSGGNADAEKGGGIASGAFGIASGLVGGTKSMFDLYGASKSKSKAKGFKNSGDADIAAISKIQAKQQGVAQVDAGLEAGKSIGNIVGGIGSIVGALGGTTAGNILYSVGTGASMLGSVGQMFNKGRSAKDAEAAAKTMTQRINQGDNQEVKDYAQNVLGINADDLKNDRHLEELIKMKMGA